MSAQAAARRTSETSFHAGQTPARDPATRRAVLAIALTEFRSYAAARLETDGRSVVLHGPNGAGKTNLLEALSFLAPGRGMRRARIEDVQRRAYGAPTDAPWAVAVRLGTPDGDVAIGTGREQQRLAAARPDGAEVEDDEESAGDSAVERRVVRIDGVAQRGQSGLAERLGVLWLTPQMDGLFREGASARRRFLDRLVYGIDPAHAGRVAGYEQAMRERSRLLRDGRLDDRWLAAVEDAMATRGVAIAAARRDLLARLAAADEARLGAFPRATMSLTGSLDAWLAEGPALAAEDRLRAALAQSRRADAAAGTTTEGPQRSDLAVVHAARGMPAGQCSTGEQKALLIAIVLANARLQGELRAAAPILLLDEVVAHLDAERRGALAGAIDELGAQAWMTGTDSALFDAIRGRAMFVTVRDGALGPEHPMREPDPKRSA